MVTIFLSLFVSAAEPADHAEGQDTQNRRSGEHLSHFTVNIKLMRPAKSKAFAVLYSEFCVLKPPADTSTPGRTVWAALG